MPPTNPNDRAALRRENGEALSFFRKSGKTCGMPKSKVIAIVGPTSSGKTALGVFLARNLDGEVISADSRQVYRGLNIGTGKVSKREMAGVPHHLLDVASLKRQFSVDDFVKKADDAIRLIYQTDKIPLIVGGTGLYVDTLLGLMSYPNVPPNAVLRSKLSKKTPQQLYSLLERIDPRRASGIERHNPRRLIRAIEIAKAIGVNPPPIAIPKYDVLWLGLYPGEISLKTKIRARLLSRMKSGMIAEARKLHAEGLSYRRMEELGLEYRYLARFLRGKITKLTMESELERAIVQYAKRQMRWFKRNRNIIWITNRSTALRLAKEFLGGR